MSLQELEKGEMHIGKNVPLHVTSPSATGGVATGAVGTPRQDVGTKLQAAYRMVGDDLLLDVTFEMSASDPPAIRKVTARGNALATPGKSALVASLDEDKKHYQLTVTPTKLR